MQARAARLYRAGRIAKGPIVNLRHIADAASAQHYGDGVAQADDLVLHRLVDITEGLEADTKKLEADRAEAEAQRQAAIAAKAAVEDLLSRQRKLLAALDVIPVMGTSQLTARQMADWFESTGMPYRLSGGMSIRELAADLHRGRRRRRRARRCRVRAVGARDRLLPLLARQQLRRPRRV